MEERAFPDSRIPDQETASQNHRLSAVMQDRIKTQTLTSLLCLPEVREPIQDHSWRSHAYVLAVSFPSWLFTPPPG